MRLAIMQPYFLPYSGYFQLIQSVDRFVIYDNIKYTKKGWINRNRFLRDGKAVVFTIPLKKASDSLDISKRTISPDFDSGKLLNKIRAAYERAPYFESAFGLFKELISSTENNLFAFVFSSLEKVCRFLAIDTEIVVSSRLPIDHSKRSSSRVLAICRAVGANVYVNPMQGLHLYSGDEFRAHGIELKGIKSRAFEYKQFDRPFVPRLSILDVIMFNSKRRICEILAHEYDLASAERHSRSHEDSLVLPARS